MTLARRMLYKIVGLTVCLLVVAGAVLWGLRSSQTAVRIARDEYLELRMILDVNERLVAARSLLHAGHARDEAVALLERARERVTEFVGFQEAQPKDVEEHEADEEQLIASVQGQLLTLTQELKNRSGDAQDRDHSGTVARIDECLLALRQLAGELDETIARAHEGSSRTLFITLGVLGTLFLIIIAATTMINISQYRSVIRQLQRMRDSTSEIAAGRFSKRLEINGDLEFARLATDFNQMAGHLEEVYDDLEKKVREKGRELARSERLASVGYLASGVAHEINNPLNIISGYAELTLKQSNSDGLRPEARKALQIIQDESFRCKEIIGKLLSLASAGDKDRKSISLGRVAHEVVSMLRSLKQTKERTILVSCDENDGLCVRGNETELKQVLLNLTINALNAVDPVAGLVRIEGNRVDDLVEIRVTDNGQGMAPETLEHVFEPFFTTQRGSEGRGIGLGLSITHAIIESHGGTVTAQSDGVGRGSTFVIRLPAEAVAKNA